MSRLLILACSDTKAEGEGLAARDRYNGPLWQTLRAADPDGSKVSVAYLSARYGLGRASKPMPLYNTLMTASIADTMIQRGLSGYYPFQKREYRTESGLAHYVVTREPIQTGGGELAHLSRDVPDGFNEVAICGGKHYVRVAEAFFAEMLDAGFAAPGARLTVINDQIGYMRSALRDWIVDGSPEPAQQPLFEVAA